MITAAGTGQQLTGLAGRVVDVVDALGPVGVGLLVAAENLFPPIPSEVILPVAGYVASRGGMGIAAAIVGATLGSLLGALALYGLGAALGPDRMRRFVRRVPLVDVTDLERAEGWFERHGSLAVLVGRCVPVVRSLISIPAGITRLPLRRFIPYTIVGSGVWNSIFIVAGFQLGARWEDVGRYSSVLNNAVLIGLSVVLAWFVVACLRRGHVN